MQIQRLKIIGLFGYINKEIDFNKDITILVGINGAGKTSILNIINWIINPSIQDLCVTEFKSIELLFNYKDNNYRVFCSHMKSTFTYKIFENKKPYNPLKVRISIKPSEIQNDDILKSSLLQEYKSLSPDENEKDTWDLIKSFPNPTVVGLDRNLYTEESQRLYLEDNFKEKLKKQASLSSSPLNRVKEIVNTEYRKKKNSILNLTNNLKNHLMFSTFDGSITIESFNYGIKHKLNLNQIETVEKRVTEYFKNFENKILSQIEQETITNYFASLKRITLNYQNTPNDETVKLLYGLNANQFIKVSKLLKEFEKFEDELGKSLKQINLYLDTLNYFFKDSSKKIVFKEDTSELTYNVLDKNGKLVSKHKDIKFLSSGEQQILILFSYITFNSQDGRVFIIDEPELSLHIKWQENFLTQLEKITPLSTQIILATHSPILANMKKEKAKLLLPYNE